MLVENSKTSVDVIFLASGIPRWLTLLGETISKAVKRGVEFRVITNRGEEEPPIGFIKSLSKFGRHKLRYIDEPPKAILAIYDKKEALLSTFAEAPWEESPTFWTNNGSLLRIFQDYFEALWIKTYEYVPEKTKYMTTA